MKDDDDKLLENIGRLARREGAEERRRFDERWRRLSAGTISEEDDAALRARAEESEETRLDYEAFRPLDPGFQARMVAQWQEQTRDPSQAEVASPALAGQRHQDMWARNSRWLAVAAMVVAAIGGGMLLRPDNERPTLPAYSTELQGARQENRSPATDTSAFKPTFTMGSTLRLTLRPTRSMDDETLERRYFFENASGELRPWRAGFSESAEGVVEVEGKVGDELPIGPGEWTLVILYGRPGRLPDSGVPDAVPSSTDDWNILRLPFRVEPNTERSTLEEPNRPLLEVEYAGCSGASPSPVCVPHRELRLWVRSAPDAEIAISIGDRAVETAGIAIDGGQLYALEVSKAAGKVEVCATDSRREACWHLTLGHDTQPNWYNEAKRLIRERRPEEARRHLNQHLEASTSGVRASVLSRLARFSGTPEATAVAYLEEAVDLHHEARQLKELANDTAMLVFFDFRNRDLEAVRKHLEVLTLPEKAPGEAAFDLFYNRGMLKSEEGKYRQALLWLQRATDLARRLELPESLFADQMQAAVLRRLGRPQDALDLLRRLYQAAQEPCDRAELLTNYTWALVLHPEARETDPLPLLEEAFEVLRRVGCSRNDLRLDLLLNSALAHVQGGRTWEARSALTEAEALVDKASSFHRLWWQDIEGRLDLDDGRGLEALGRYQHMESLARQSEFPEGQWRAKVGQARALEILGDLEPALAALADAEELLAQGHLDVPLDQGREAFVAQREAGARLHLELLLRAGRDAEALATARRARARVLNALHRGHRLAHLTAGEEATWDESIASYLQLRARIEADAADAQTRAVPHRQLVHNRLAGRWQEARRALDRAFGVVTLQSDLPPLHAGEVVLTYHPLPHGWVGFAATPNSVESHRFDLAADVFESSEELSRRLLEPFHEAIRAAAKIRVLPYGELRGVDFHALPFDGDILLSGRPVVYGLDLVAPAPEKTIRRRALVIPAAPLSGLSSARAEAGAVAESLRSLPVPWSVRLLDSEDATAARVRELVVGDLDLLHYSGHGQFRGVFGWESALHLAGDTQLALGDILALKRVPSRVVLSSCETGLETAEAPVASLGLAQAFVVAGAHSVVAAVQPVDDADTEKLFRDFYRRWDASTDLALLLRHAQLTWRQTDPGTEWASFRAFEP